MARRKCRTEGLGTQKDNDHAFGTLDRRRAAAEAAGGDQTEQGSACHAIELPTDDPQTPDLLTWAAYTIRPNAGDSIASAEQWLIKRKWQPWT
jgi:hypothetical protein